MHSESINELVAALVKAQGELRHAKADAKNPHFKSFYATLESIIEASRPALSKHGLAMMQTTAIDNGANVLRTTLAHISGQWIDSITPILQERPGPQPYGGGLTYARRYAWGAMIGLATTEDDDGNVAQEPPKPQPKSQPKSQPKPQSKPADTLKVAHAEICERYKSELEPATLNSLWGKACDVAGAKNADAIAVFSRFCERTTGPEAEPVENMDRAILYLKDDAPGAEKVARLLDMLGVK